MSADFGSPGEGPVCPLKADIAQVQCV